MEVSAPNSDSKLLERTRAERRLRAVDFPCAQPTRKRGRLTTDAAAWLGSRLEDWFQIAGPRAGAPSGQPAKVPALRSTAAAQSLACCGLFRICFELANCGHGGCGGVFALAVFLAAFGFADVMILSHGVSRFNRRLETPALTSLRDNELCHRRRQWKSNTEGKKDGKIERAVTLVML
jgi:hypothetical protein